MIFYILGLIIFLLVVAILVLAYFKYSNNKGKHKKSEPNKVSFNYYKDSEEADICILNKKSIKDCNAIKELNIDKDITDIEDKCFINFTNLSSIKVDEENKSFCSKLGVLFSKDMKKIICYPPSKQTSTYFIPQGVESINTHAFFNNNYLKYIIIPTSISRIDENSFVNCKFINQVVIPENVKEIHPHAFNICPRITIRCYKGSAAEDFCKRYFIPFEYLSN